MSRLITTIVVRTRFEALHNWPGCNLPEVMYLARPHRHVFHVEAKWKVKHDDRDLEFITMKRTLNTYITEHLSGRFLKGISCEMIARELLAALGCVFVSVFEDGENGAEVSDVG